jgi:hypothetical protein
VCRKKELELHPLQRHGCTKVVSSTSYEFPLRVAADSEGFTWVHVLCYRQLWCEIILESCHQDLSRRCYWNFEEINKDLENCSADVEVAARTRVYAE